MINHVPYATEHLESIKNEINNYIFSFIGVSTVDEVESAVYNRRLRVMMYQGIPSYAMPYTSPRLNELLETLKIKYGEVIDSTIWVGTSKSVTPVLSAADRKFNFFIPCATSADFKIQYYNYSGSTSVSVRSNNEVDISIVNVPDDLNLLTPDDVLVSPSAGWIRADRLQSINNWTPNIFIYAGFKFENQDLIESELFTE